MLQVLNGPIIQGGEFLSEGIDCSAGQLVRITMPPEWTPAPLTFQFLTDGVFYNDMFGIDGFEVTIKTVVSGAGVIIPTDVGRAIAHLKIRSGTRNNPMPQPEPRNFAVTILVEGAAAASAQDFSLPWDETKREP